MRVVRSATILGALLSVGLFVASVPLVLGTKGTDVTDSIWPFQFAAMAVVGAFVASRRPENVTGWLFMTAGLVMMGAVVAQDYMTYAMTRPGGLPATDFVAWVGFWVWMPGSGLIALVLVVFPTGRAPNAFWRWFVRVASFLIALTCVAAVPILGTPASVIARATSPRSIPHGEALNFLGTGPLPILLPIGFIALATRFVRSKGIEREQMKWFAFAASLLALVAAVAGALGALGVEDPLGHPVVGASTFVAMTAIPVAAGVAILRYRLYEIDRIISRTFSYAVVSAFLGATFALIALVPPIVVGADGAGVPDYGIAAATLVVAALFRPVRRRVQNVVDHRFNRTRFAATRTIEIFTARLREQVDIDAVGVELRELVDKVMRPSHVSLWLRPYPGRGRSTP